MDCYIPRLRLSTEQRAEYLAVVRRGAKCLRRWHKKASEKAKITQMDFRGLLFYAIDAGEREAGGVVVSKTAVGHIQAVRDIEYTMLCAYSSLIERVVRRYCGVADMQHMTWTGDDVYAEAATAMVNAIYGYSRKDVKFITYAYTVMRRRIWNASYRMVRNGPRWPKTLCNFKSHYDAEVASSLGEMTYDELIEVMGLSNEEARILSQGLSEMNERGDCDCDCDCDFVQPQTERLDADQAAAIEAVCLRSELHRGIVEGIQSGHWGWRQDVATRCGVSRQHVKQEIPRMRRKVLTSYLG